VTTGRVLSRERSYKYGRGECCVPYYNLIIPRRRAVVTA
jgi:hypothetical protein